VFVLFFEGRGPLDLRT